MSIARGFSQVPTRADSLWCPAGVIHVGYTDDDVTAIFAKNQTLSPPIAFENLGSVYNFASLADLESFYANSVKTINSGLGGSVALVTNAQYNDMGKRIHFAVGGQVVATWTKVQLVTFPSGAGVVNNLPFYTITFSADTTHIGPAHVVRLG